MMPIPSDEAFYSVCDSNEKLGELGPGFPLFFEFIKYVTYLLLILCIVYFLPAAGLIAKTFIDVRKA